MPETRIQIPKRFTHPTLPDPSDPNAYREIFFPEGYMYAVVLADIYGSMGYSTHKYPLRAIYAYRKNGTKRQKIIDRFGTEYHIEGNRLVPCNLQKETQNHV